MTDSVNTPEDLALPVPLSPEAEWLSVVKLVPEPCRALVAEVVTTHASSLADHFYAGMLQHREAVVFLDHTTVHERLHGSMMRWLQAVYAHPLVDEDQVAALIALQRHVGEVHARIQLPIHLVARGARQLKVALFNALEQAMPNPSTHAQTIRYAGHLMDLALELMSGGHLRNTERVVRNDEAYRLFSLGQNISVEREKQRSALLEWGQNLLFSLHRDQHTGQLPRLGNSEFGLWFHHKASAMFEGSPEIGQINDIIERIDSTLLPRLGAHGVVDKATLMADLESELHGLKFLLSTLFERQLEVENGRDTLTRLLNRRFLPSVMNREIRMAQKRQSSFALLLLDIDHFKKVNDQHGHDAGDQVLQQAASILLNSVRNGDFVFRYGGEEMLVMLVEVTQELAMRVAQSIRAKFESTDFLLSEGGTLRVTASIGVAMYDGHPDQHFLISQADQAMYQAKQNGRNRVHLAPGKSLPDTE